MALEKRTVFAAFGRVAIVAGIVVAFALGLAGAVYLSLRSREVSVPDVVGQHYLKAQDALEEAQLNIRRRAKRHKDDAPPDTVLDQSPRAGEIVKAGQTIAVVVSDEESGKNAPPADGQAPEGQATPDPTPQADAQANANENRNRNQNNRNANRNANNRNANNRNSNNANNRNANANNRNANSNNRNANGNSNRPNANTNNRNTNGRTPNVNANRSNANSGRTNSNGGASNRNANRRPTP